MVTRRRVLTAALTATSAGLFTGAALTPLGTARSARADTAATGEPSAIVEPFRIAMPIPPVLAPVSTSGGTDTYIVTMQRAEKEILPGKLTEVLTYNGSFPGPTIKARAGRPVVVQHHNALDMPASVHLHGGEVPPDSDGAPMDTIAPGSARTYTYPNQQPHASLWFHDHAHHMESEHVYRGLSAFYLLTDDVEQELPLPSGAYDIPIALRDARFDLSGQLVYAMDDTLGRTTVLANGRPFPYVQVAARKYRFRLLNSANLRFFNLRLADGSPMVQIGSDGGLLERPHTTDSVFLSPGERADIVIDFSRYPVGTRLVLGNTLGLGLGLGPGPDDRLGQVLRFDVVRTEPDPSEVPAILRSLPPLPDATVRRTIELNMDEDGRANPAGYVNGKTYDPDRIDTTIPFGSTEIWSVTNTNLITPHNFHMHLVQFRVLERNGNPPGPAESGLKDTVRVLPGETVKVLATFNSHRGTYMYHCHLLDHSAMGMMAQMRIV